MCYFIAHEHLLKEHIYPHTASGDTPVLEYRRLRSHISKLVTSKFFQKWCSRGVASAFSLRETLDFTGFSRTFKDMHDSITYGIHYRFVLLRVMIHVNMQGLNEALSTSLWPLRCIHSDHTAAQTSLPRMISSLSMRYTGARLNRKAGSRETAFLYRILGGPHLIHLAEKARKKTWGE